jgi:hypothetical protein
MIDFILWFLDARARRRREKARLHIWVPRPNWRSHRGGVEYW